MTLSLLDFKHLIPNPDATPLDWTVPFNALMNDNEVEVKIPPGNYYMRYPGKITKPKEVTAIGANIDMPGTLQISSPYFTLKGLTINGVREGDFSKLQNAVHLENAKNVIFDRCNFNYLSKNAINFSSVGKCEDVRIESCNFNGIGSPMEQQFNIQTMGFPVYIQSAERVYVTYGTMKNIYGQSAIFGRRCTTVVIEDVTIESTAYRGIQTFGEIGSTDPTDCIKDMHINRCTIRYTGVYNTTLKGEATNGIFIRNPQGKVEDVKISNCLIEYCGENCLEGSFEAYNNTLKYSGWYDRFTTDAKEGVYLHGNSLLINNKIISPKKEGIKVFTSRRNITIKANHIHDAGLSSIYVHADKEAVIDSIIITENTVRYNPANTSKPINLLATNGGKITNFIEDNNLVVAQ